MKPATTASLSNSRSFLILTNSCCKFAAVSVFSFKNSLTGLFMDIFTRSSTYYFEICLLMRRIDNPTLSVIVAEKRSVCLFFAHSVINSFS